MKILLISHSDIKGGAARACYRLHRCLLKHGYNSSLWVSRKYSDDETVRCINDSAIKKVTQKFKQFISRMIFKLQKDNNLIFRSGNWFPSNFPKLINESDFDIVNIHWIGNETLSISDLIKIGKPIIWTLHDMWPFCGAEHYADTKHNARWKNGYTGKMSGYGIDLDKKVWIRKIPLQKRQLSIISPSSWLADCVKASALFKDKPTYIIPNILDPEVFKPVDKISCREIFSLPIEKKILLFGAVGGSNDPRKGFDLLQMSLLFLSEKYESDDIICVIFGQNEPKFPINTFFETKWLGHIEDDHTLALLYNSADVTIVPSRQDNLPQVATEAQACGCPVIAFNCTGLPDAVEHKLTGYLAKPFDPIDLAYGIEFSLENHITCEVRQNIQNRAISLWSPTTILSRYIAGYQKSIDDYWKTQT